MAGRPYIRKSKIVNPKSQIVNRMPILALLFFIFAIYLLFQSGKQRREAGLPGGRVIYTDTRAWGAVEKPLYDHEFDLTGKPDYLIQQGEVIIPVEVKSGKAPESPYDSHIFQVAAYCLLVHRTYRVRPPYGIIHYNDRDFAVDYTLELEKELIDILTEMRRDEVRTEVNRSHEQRGRCAKCGFREMCSQKIE
jgi:CRISPR-associated exonuclease Cas4